jgi:shikimate dehydrogenase
VTVPHKEYAFNLCDEVQGIAQKIGAVNTLVTKKNQIIGYNTDALGFFRSIESFKDIKSALILGAGGTAKAISFILNENSIKTTILNRSQNRLDFFRQAGFECFNWDTFKIDKFDIIINTTPAGLMNKNLPLEEKPLSMLMAKSKYAFDVIYGGNTPFLKLAKQNSLLYKDGSDMLLHQASIAFNLFYKNTQDLNIIENYMKKSMSL